VYDCSTMHKISHVSKPKNAIKYQLDCHLQWREDDQLLIAWGCSIKIGQVKDKPRVEVAPGFPSRYLEIVGVLECDYILCGLVPLGTDYVVLSYCLDSLSASSDACVGASRPEVKIIGLDGEERSSDALSLSNFEVLQAKDYHLAMQLREVQFFIHSPHEIVLCKPCDEDDHIGWLLDHEKFKEALKAAKVGEKAHRLNSFTVKQVGQKYLQHLISNSAIF
jgi:hypothetical protein